MSSLKTQIHSQSLLSQPAAAIDHDLGKGKAVLQLLSYLASLAPKMMAEKSSAASVGQSSGCLCKQVIMFFTKIGS